MPAAGVLLGLAAVDGLLFAVKGDGTVDAYDRVSDTWSAKASLPSPVVEGRTAIADGVLYAFISSGPGTSYKTVYAYDDALDAWSVRASQSMFEPAAGLNGLIYMVGSLMLGNSYSSWPYVYVFIDSLRWSSSAPTIVPTTRDGTAAPLRVGVATIRASVGAVSCGTGCATFTVYTTAPTEMALDQPSNGATFVATAPLTLAGWTLNSGAPAGTGVDTLHIYAAPASGPAIFLGVATCGVSRPDVGAVYGSQFTNSGFSLSAGDSLAAGSYTIAVYAHNALTGAFDAVRTTHIQVTALVSNGLMSVDTPTPGATLTSAFEVGGWAIDTGAPAGTGVDAVQFYVFPNDGASPGVFIGQGSYGSARPDVGAVFGARFTNAGYHSDHRSRPGRLPARRLRAQHRHQHLQHRPHAALHGRCDGVDVDRLAASGGGDRGAVVRRGGLVDRSRGRDDVTERHRRRPAARLRISQPRQRAVADLPGRRVGRRQSARRRRALRIALQRRRLHADRRSRGGRPRARRLRHRGVLAQRGYQLVQQPRARARDVAIAGSGHACCREGRTYWTDLWRSLGDGRMTASAQIVSFGPATMYDNAGSSTNVALADINHDGKLDLIVAINGPARIRIRLGDGIGSFGAPTDLPAATGCCSDVVGVAIADFNGDGHPDIATTGGYDDIVIVFPGHGDGSFEPGVRSVSAATTPKT